MNLSPEDQLRLNVLLANPVDAVRIDENTMVLHALSGDDEARVKLNPNCRNDQYLRRVREVLSGQVLGSPGGYPVYLKRWTRMGQAREANLGELLKLGEPEAVIAVAGAAGLSDDLARRVWWVSPNSDTARCMLEREAVRKGTMGALLVNHLVEHLPFETEPLTMIQTVKLILETGLIDDETRLQLWNKGKKKRAYLVGFLMAQPDDLPEPLPKRDDYDVLAPQLESMAHQGNPYAKQLLKILNSAGQTFAQIAAMVLERPYNQDDVVAALNAIRNYYTVTDDTRREQDINTIIDDAERCCQNETSAQMLLSTLPQLANELKALLILGRCSDDIVTPIFARSDAIGTVMRRKLEPVTTPIFAQFSALRGTL